MFIVMRGGAFPYPVGVAADEAVALVRSALLPGDSFYLEVPEFVELVPSTDGDLEEIEIPARSWQGNPVVDRPLT